MIEKAVTIEGTLRKIITGVTHKKCPALNPASTFKELGADSLDVVQIMVALEDRFDIDLVDEEMKSISNMGEFILYIQKKVDDKRLSQSSNHSL